MPDKNQRVVIIGAGPIGLETALHAQSLGFPVTILEKESPGANIRRWDHVTFFSPFKMNHSALGRQLLESNGQTLPGDEEYLNGDAYLKQYLEPIAESLGNAIVNNCEVLAISRRRTLKRDHTGSNRRSEMPFRILTRSNGGEKFYNADILIDASGTYDQNNWLGDGGIPAIGESAHRDKICYHIPDITGSDQQTYRGKTTLVAGSGHSAATSLVKLSQLIEQDKNTRVVWLNRTAKEQPLEAIEDDPLVERNKIVQAANAVAGHTNVEWLQSAVICEVQHHQDSRSFTVTIESEGCEKILTVDNIIANVGYTPDNEIYRELQVHECYASRGPMKLAAALLGDAGGDCLTQTSKGPEVLKNPEPNFFILGIKSYGRSPNFLIRVGLEQIQDVFQLLVKSEK